MSLIPKIINIGSLHNDGKAELTVGLRGHSFKLQLSTDGKSLIITNPSTNQKLQIDSAGVVENSSDIKIGDLNQLKTSNKSSLVDAINELYDSINK